VVRPVVVDLIVAHRRAATSDVRVALIQHEDADVVLIDLRRLDHRGRVVHFHSTRVGRDVVAAKNVRAAQVREDAVVVVLDEIVSQGDTASRLASDSCRRVVLDRATVDEY